MNEAEVETKILIYVFELLGYTDDDRADKCHVRMHYGREKEDKVADFILYDGLERSAVNALIAVEAKGPSEPLPEGEEQVRSYATFAGTPFYMVCNGAELLVALHIPGASRAKKIKIRTNTIGGALDELRTMLGRDQAVLAKESLEYIVEEFPNLEDWPAALLLKRYLTELHGRFKNFIVVHAPLEHTTDPHAEPRIPVTIALTSKGGFAEEMDAEALAERLASRTSRFLVLGDPGSGKSTLCRRVTHRLAEAALLPGAQFVPVYVNLRAGTPKTIAEAFFACCTSMRVPIRANLYQRSLAKTHIALVLDGLDEIEDIEGAQKRVEDMLSASAEASVLITARTHIESRAARLLYSCRLSTAKIKDLSSLEVEGIFKSYLEDPTQTTAILDAEKRGALPSLHSPMFVLMAIRVANLDRSWTATSIFELYERYVGTLHEYFNLADAMSGAVSTERVLSTLSRASTILATAIVKGRAMSLQNLVEELAKGGRMLTIRSLLRTGLLSSSSGQALFSHKSFFEFGLARTILADLRAERPSDPSVISLANQNVYLLVRSSVSAAEEELFRALFASADARTKRMLLGVFRCRCSAETLDVIWESFQKDGGGALGNAMLRTLMANQDRRLEPWLIDNASKLGKKKLRQAAYWLRHLGAPGSARAALAIADVRFNPLWIKAALDNAFKYANDELVEGIVTRYRTAKPRARATLIGAMARHKKEPGGAGILNAVALLEESPRLSLSLFGIALSAGVRPGAEVVAHWTKVLSAPEGYWTAKEYQALGKLREKLSAGRDADFASLVAVLDEELALKR